MIAVHCPGEGPDRLQLLVEGDRPCRRRTEGAPIEPQTVDLDRAARVPPGGSRVIQLSAREDALHRRAEIKFVNNVSKRADRARQLYPTSIHRKGDRLTVSSWRSWRDGDRGLGRVDLYTCGCLDRQVSHHDPQTPGTFTLDRDDPVRGMRYEACGCARAGGSKVGREPLGSCEPPIGQIPWTSSAREHGNVELGRWPDRTVAQRRCAEADPKRGRETADLKLLPGGLDLVRPLRLRPVDDTRLDTAGDDKPINRVSARGHQQRDEHHKAEAGRLTHARL